MMGEWKWNIELILKCSDSDDNNCVVCLCVFILDIGDTIITYFTSETNVSESFWWQRINKLSFYLKMLCLTGTQ